MKINTTFTYLSHLLLHTFIAEDFLQLVKYLFNKCIYFI